ncbi:hypothetical protein E3J62_11375 [candidate division TA06 bacterium]|uniref:Uncharacterized protein n=1 Tax=candidate division TA06 bacterium TaxID=2250710 RepID=A0A523UNZ5_UNCT6|nr:MAG: hypothetical protein E3J62_11375 [candidate division TA06 bacterium]
MFNRDEKLYYDALKSEQRMIKPTILFWRRRFGIELSEKEAREAVRIIADLVSFVAKVERQPF